MFNFVWVVPLHVLLPHCCWNNLPDSNCMTGNVCLIDRSLDMSVILITLRIQAHFVVRNLLCALVFGVHHAYFQLYMHSPRNFCSNNNMSCGKLCFAILYSHAILLSNLWKMEALCWHYYPFAGWNSWVLMIMNPLLREGGMLTSVIFPAVQHTHWHFEIWQIESRIHHWIGVWHLPSASHVSCARE